MFPEVAVEDPRWLPWAERLVVDLDQAWVPQFDLGDAYRSGSLPQSFAIILTCRESRSATAPEAVAA